MHNDLFPDIRTVTVPIGTDITLVGPNMRRQALVIGAPAANRVDLSFRGPAVSGQGLAIWPKTLPVQLSVEYIGRALHEEIRATATGGPETITVIDLFYG